MPGTDHSPPHAPSPAVMTASTEVAPMKFATSATPAWNWWVALVIGVVTFLAYQPAWHGGVLWDDPAHMTVPELRSWQGLYRIWFDLKATQQYYPLLHSAFWLQDQLWGQSTLGHHLVNIVMHLVVVLLAWRVMRRLEVPGAGLAACVFALHPVHVESVAWITELKNTLSGAFYLAALLFYLGFIDRRAKLNYAIALLLFVLALLTKTVTATLPAAVLVLMWWKRGRLDARRDVLPLTPFFLLGVCAGLFTAWVEHHMIGAQGSAFALSPLDRILIAGRASWFYFGKLIWPTDMLFIYPRWEVDAGQAWQWLFPVAAIAMLGALTVLARRGQRGPLAAALLFGGTLLPALGFFNVYPFRFSFVADHFQYLASLSVLALLSNVMVMACQRAGTWAQPTRWLVSAGLVSTLAVLSYRQTPIYADAETLYRHTIAGNPDCWLARNNMADILIARKDYEEAEQQLEQAIAVYPHLAEMYLNLGKIRLAQRRIDEAIKLFDQTLQMDPALTIALERRGYALTLLGRWKEAEAVFEEAVRRRPGLALGWANLGMCTARRGQFAEAQHQLQKALFYQPDLIEARINLGLAQAKTRQFEAAERTLREAIAREPSSIEAHVNLGQTLEWQNRWREAAAIYEKALTINPGHAETLNNLAVALASLNRKSDAIGHLRRAVEIKPDYLDAVMNLAILQEGAGQREQAIENYRHMLTIVPNHPRALAAIQRLSTATPATAPADP